MIKKNSPMKERFLFRGKERKPTGEAGKWVVGNISEIGHKLYIDTTPIDGGKTNARVLPETVGQCTGLKDKNGKLIFEGDIIRYFIPEDERDGCDVDEFGCEGKGRSFVWDNTVAAFKTYEFERGNYAEIIPNRDYEYCDAYHDDICLSVEDISEEYIIVGSVHDNLELLEEEND